IRGTGIGSLRSLAKWETGGQQRIARFSPGESSRIHGAVALRYFKGAAVIAQRKGGSESIGPASDRHARGTGSARALSDRENPLPNLARSDRAKRSSAAR